MRCALVGRQLGQAEHPARRRAVRGARVDQAGRRVGRPAPPPRAPRRRAGTGRRRRPRSAGGRARPGPCACSGVDAQHLDVAALREVLVDAQAGGAFLAVDEDAGRSCRIVGRWTDSIKQRAALACPPRDCDRQSRPMATKKPKGLGLGLEALLGPRVVEAGAGAGRRRRAARAARSTSCSPAATSRARAWTRARSTSWPRASRRRA